MQEEPAAETDTRIRMSVDSDRAQVVTSGVSSPATTSVVRRAAILKTVTRDREEVSAPTALPIPLKRRIVNSTTLNP